MTVPRLFPTLLSSGYYGEQGVFLPQSAQSFAQGAQGGYGANWCSSTTEIVKAQRAGAAHREADGGEYHPVSRLAGMRVGGQVGEQAYSKIAYSADGEWEEILRLPCRAALQDGRAGSISMSLEFLVLFFQEKSTEQNFMINSTNYRPRFSNPLIFSTSPLRSAGITASSSNVSRSSKSVSEYVTSFL